MAKKQDFSAKVAKQAKLGNICPVCNTAYSFIKKVDSYYSEKSESWKFADKNVKLCHCNEKEIYS